ncbi:hypothetical protein [Vibrio alginolyticus]|uniref:hypothetical protein n=1 Tax=Vibrio TaxID=662 RepID=UPI0006CAA0CC|nr:hypothetical protein [Vibrio alginolyticus]CAH7138219.1 conserved hypothetical protein [Vibrio chagasii]CAH7229407.1 conserved hypothetical protein [Vibrio chagasii]
MNNNLEQVKDQVIISEMGDNPELYEVTFKGAAEEYNYDNQTDELEAVDAHEIAKEVADETNSEIIWECIKPGWA